MYIYLKVHCCCYITITNTFRSGPWFNIKMSSYQYRKSHCGDKTVVRSSYLHNGISFTGKMSSLYRIRDLNLTTISQYVCRIWPLWCGQTWDFIGWRNWSRWNIPWRIDLHRNTGPNPSNIDRNYLQGSITTHDFSQHDNDPACRDCFAEHNDIKCIMCCSHFLDWKIIKRICHFVSTW